MPLGLTSHDGGRAPILNLPAGIPGHRLQSEKALGLYHFIEKLVRKPGRVEIRRKVTLDDQAEKVLGVAEEENIDLVVLVVRQRSFFHLMAGGKQLRMISRLPCPVLLEPPLDESCPNVRCNRTLDSRSVIGRLLRRRTASKKLKKEPITTSKCARESELNHPAGAVSCWYSLYYNGAIYMDPMTFRSLNQRIGAGVLGSRSVVCARARG